MTPPGTRPLEGQFWYILDDQNEVEWRPRPKVRGEFYLGWLGQNKNVIAAGLAKMKQGHLAHLCVHGTPYYWLQPHQVLPFTYETLTAQDLPEAVTVELDFSLGGWELRDQTRPEVRHLPDDPVPAAQLGKLLLPAVQVIVRNFSSENGTPPLPQSSGLLARVPETSELGPEETLLEKLIEAVKERNVIPVLMTLVGHDTNVIPTYRHSAFFEKLPSENLPPASKVARLVVSAVYHLGPLLESQRLASTLLLNSLRQRHPFDVTWGSDFLVKSLGLSYLVRLLQAAVFKEKDDQVRGNVLDLLQELGYGVSAGLEAKVLENLTRLSKQEGPNAFGQVVTSHLAFLQEYLRLRDAAHPTG